MNDPHRQARTGFALGLSAYFVWGVLPLYFKALATVAPTEIVAHRILWSVFFLAPLVLLGRRLPGIFAAITTPRLAMILAVTATLIGANWLIYIYAVVRGHVLEASLGYYLNPLVNVLLGIFVLKEKLSTVQKGAVALAAVGVATLAFRAGGALWISLGLAFSFALYGFLRKVTPVEAVEGVAIETIFLVPIALGWILWLQQHGQSAFLHDRPTDLLLIFGG